MTTEQTSQQLELAAQLIRTGHPWEWLSVDNKWIKAYHNKPEVEIATGHRIRPILATPPDNRPLHNPDNLTAEQVGLGYRLLTEDEFQKDAHLQHQEWWSIGVRPKSWMVEDLGRSRSPELNFGTTYRLPLSVPWPEPQPDPYAELKKAHAEGKVIQFVDDGDIWRDIDEPNWKLSANEYRIKPEPALQLPPPPPGMQWHRTDMWQEGDLPQGMRPLVAGEESGNGTQQKYDTGWVKLHNSVIADAEENPMRTSRPLTFTHAGKAWTWHRPGDPMPCDGGRRVECVFADHVFWINNDLLGKDVRWTNDNDIGDIIGWRYADEKKTVPLGPEDVPPGSEFRFTSSLLGVSWTRLGANANGVVLHTPGQELNSKKNILRTVTWNEMSDMQINRSIPLTGKWNPDAWEPCHKPFNKMGKP